MEKIPQWICFEIKRRRLQRYIRNDVEKSYRLHEIACFRVKIDVLVSIRARKHYANTAEKKYAEGVDVEKAKDS